MKVWIHEAYEMYALGISYPVISEHIGEKESTIRYHIKKYAYQNQLVYPRLKPNYELAFNLHYNGMSVYDIGRYMGVCKQTARNYIQKHSDKCGIPKQEHSKSQVAYNLRMQGFTYNQVAKMLGYHDRSNCYRSIKKYERESC